MVSKRVGGQKGNDKNRTNIRQLVAANFIHWNFQPKYWFWPNPINWDKHNRKINSTMNYQWTCLHYSRACLPIRRLFVQFFPISMSFEESPSITFIDSWFQTSDFRRISSQCDPIECDCSKCYQILRSWFDLFVLILLVKKATKSTKSTVYIETYRTVVIFQLRRLWSFRSVNLMKSTQRLLLQMIDRLSNQYWSLSMNDIDEKDKIFSEYRHQLVYILFHCWSTWTKRKNF